MARKHVSVLIALAGVSLAATLMISSCSSFSQSADKDDSKSRVFSADLVVIGAGGAGMTAAIEARRAGASVIVVEKSASLGGNTLATMSGLNAVGTDVQKAAGSTASVQEFTKIQTNAYARPALVQSFVDNSAKGISFLESIGMKFNVDKDKPYTHLPANGQTGGVALVDALSRALKDSGAAILVNTTATSLIVEKGAVVGVLAKDAAGKTLTFKSSAVVLATGGFGQNSALVYKNNPSLTGAITDEIAPTTGDGIVMAKAVGAVTVDLDKFTTFPIVETKTHSMVFPMYLPGDSIFVGVDGKRFAAEGFDDPTTRSEMLKRGTVYAIFDQKHLDSASGLQTLNKQGVVAKGQSIAELAKAKGIDAESLQATVSRWNADVASGKDSAFGRSGMHNDISSAPFYALSIGVGVHYCLGGILISPDAQVVDAKGAAIPGLYAAGEVTGGIHGDTKIDGSTVAASVIFGRIAADNAASYAAKLGSRPLVAPHAKVFMRKVSMKKGHFKDGVFEGSGAGRSGDVKVSVTVENGNITDIKILSMEETEAKIEAIQAQLIPEILEAQSLKVDAVSGATLSSDAVVDAVAQALRISRD